LGANAAMRAIDPPTFRVLVQAGVVRMQAAGADVILMDNQRSPRILAAPEHRVLEDTLAAIAAATGVNLFSRGALMDAWASLGYPYAEFLADDALHHNDLGYRCVAEALASAMTGRTVSAAR